MIVRIMHAENADGPMLVYSDPNSGNPVVDFIDPTDELLVMLAGDRDGYFEAERDDTGWNIRRRVDDQGW